MTDHSQGGGGPAQPAPRRALPDADETLEWTPSPTPSAAEELPVAPQRSYQEPADGAPTDPPTAALEYAVETSRAPLILGVVILLAVAAVIAYLALRDRDPGTAEPAPSPAVTFAATPTETAPVEATTAPAVTETAEPAPEGSPGQATDATGEATAEGTATQPPEPEQEPSSEPSSSGRPSPTGDPQPLTSDDLPDALAGYELGDDLTYRLGDRSILLADLGIRELDPAWQEMTFPDAQPVSDNAFCSADDGGGQGCFLISATHGIITASGDPGEDITEFVVALAGHLA